jgi:hypothetical protein
MINGHTLLPRSWIRHDLRGIQRFVTLLPRYRDAQLPIPAYYLGDEPLEWLINGCTEDEWSGISLTPAHLLRNGFVLRQDNEWITSYGLPNNFFVTWINDIKSPLAPRGSIITGPGEIPIAFVHELQLQYLASTRKQLPFIL